MDENEEEKGGSMMEIVNPEDVKEFLERWKKWMKKKERKAA